MKTVICYYSRHHGNTRKVLEAMAEEGAVDLVDVTTRQSVRLEEYDCVGLASGIYGFEVQKAVVEFARQYLPQGKPVYIHCHSGLRSYIACRMLSGYGFDCYNLCGGYRLYQSVISGRNIPDHSCLDPK